MAGSKYNVPQSADTNSEKKIAAKALTQPRNSNSMAGSKFNTSNPLDTRNGKKETKKTPKDPAKAENLTRPASSKKNTSKSANHFSKKQNAANRSQITDANSLSNHMEAKPNASSRISNENDKIQGYKQEDFKSKITTPQPESPSKSPPTAYKWTRLYDTSMYQSNPTYPVIPKLTDGIEPSFSAWKAMVQQRFELEASEHFGELNKLVCAFVHTDMQAMEAVQMKYGQLGYKVVDEMFADLEKRMEELEGERK